MKWMEDVAWITSSCFMTSCISLKLETSFYVLEVIYSPDLSNTVTSLSIAVCLSSNHPSQCKSPLTLLVTTAVDCWLARAMICIAVYSKQCVFDNFPSNWKNTFWDKSLTCSRALRLISYSSYFSVTKAFSDLHMSDFYQTIISPWLYCMSSVAQRSFFS